MNIAAEEMYRIAPDETFDVSLSLLQPWSVPVMKTQLPPKILHMMIGLSDAIIESGQGEPWGKRLAGQISNELLMSNAILAEAGLLGFFENMLRQYVYRCQCQKYPNQVDTVMQNQYKTQVTQMWIVSQFENEYNPAHIHPNCDISAVMYLKVPEMLPSRKTHRQDDDGSIVFLGGSSGDPKLSTPLLQLKPKVGDLYFFGSSQLHAVYPFRYLKGTQEGERRSISFNAKFEMLDPEVKP